MNISLEWLAQYLPGASELHSLADTLTNGGFVTENFSTVGPDQVMDVEVTSNRGDCLSHLGIARELSAPPPPHLPLSLSITSPLCPHYSARVIRNVEIAPSPAWLQRRLIAVGL